MIEAGQLGGAAIDRKVGLGGEVGIVAAVAILVVAEEVIRFDGRRGRVAVVEVVEGRAKGESFVDLMRTHGQQVILVGVDRQAIEVADGRVEGNRAVHGYRPAGEPQRPDVGGSQLHVGRIVDGVVGGVRERRQGGGIISGRRVRYTSGAVSRVRNRVDERRAAAQAAAFLKRDIDRNVIRKGIFVGRVSLG